MSHPHTNPMTAVALFFAMVTPLQGLAQSTLIYLGDSKHPAVSGEAWPIANRWGAYQGVLVAMIREGTLEESREVQFPQYWEQAFDYKLLLAVSDQTVESPKSQVEDFAYGTVDKPEYLKRFPNIYLSVPLAAENRGKDWPSALEQMGHRAKDGLVLPRPMRRTIRLLYPDGKPLMGVPVPVSLYGSSSNHCGVAVGVKLAISTTDTHGEIHVVATNSPLALSMHHYEEKSEGPAGKAFVSVGDLTVGEPGNITVKKLWTLLEHDYAVRIKTSDDHPIPRARLKACMFLGGCGAGCGPVNAPESDSSGLIRFRAEDLRMMESLTAVDEHGSERQLTHSEMRELLTTYRLELAWE